MKNVEEGAQLEHCIGETTISKQTNLTQATRPLLHTDTLPGYMTIEVAVAPVRGHIVEHVLNMALREKSRNGSHDR